MIDQTDILKFLKDQLPDFREEYNISKIGLIGSFARNEQNDNSDIDIILEFLPGTENIYEKKKKLRELLSLYFKRDIDLCREKYIKSYIKAYLEKEVIYV